MILMALVLAHSLQQPPQHAIILTEDSVTITVPLHKREATEHDPYGQSKCGDVNGDGVVDVKDVFYLINYIFAEGPAPECKNKDEDD